jgi:hypothetical protein
MSASLTPEEIAQARRLCERLEHVLRVAPPAPGQSWRMVRGDLLDEMAALLPRLLDALEAAEAERDAAYDACAALGWRTPADETIRAERDRYRVAWEAALLESTRQHERAERLARAASPSPAGRG